MKNEIPQKGTSIILVIILALVLIAIVIWVFNKRIEQIEGSADSGASITKDLRLQFTSFEAGKYCTSNLPGFEKAGTKEL